ncbi:hypothetical protein BJ741DRAFT_15092 [Chytriomyces cf. hyalinus JEL632]|nr:hypothetical protein BJ741DRAFT_15092 [Chytriomyces cf. hyalinus JEL632]
MRLTSTLQLVNPATSLPSSFHRERSRFGDRADPIDAIPSSSMLRASSVSALLTTPLAQGIFSSNPQPHGSMNMIHAVELKAVIHSNVPASRTQNHQRRFFVTDRSVPSHQLPNILNRFSPPVKQDANFFGNAGTHPEQCRSKSLGTSGAIIFSLELSTASLRILGNGRTLTTSQLDNLSANRGFQYISGRNAGFNAAGDQ